MKDWHYMDYEKDGFRGISLNKAYELLKGRKSKTVIVAVIDSGIDTLQPDLKSMLWTNSLEIPYNNLDEDKNGLIDDYYGWNYLGAPNGENLSISIGDDYRTYHRFKDQFENRDSNKIPSHLKWQYHEWLLAVEAMDTVYKNAKENIAIVLQNWQIITKSSEALKKILNNSSFTNKDLAAIKTTKSNIEHIELWKNIFNGKDFSNEQFIKSYENFKKQLEDDLIKKSTAPHNYRDEILHDNGYDISKTKYGNNNLSTHSGYHGTSVSSIIGAVRNNQLGINGIADNVKLMMIRGILGKDEFDKDVALSIRYAVDHGAKVINMSFGKYISPDKHWVDEAIKYALLNDVVIVHAAGNDARDTDKYGHYPSAFTIENDYMPNMITVGASSNVSNGNAVAPFSNYGKKTVDVFAPGVDIRCLISGSGTQVASGTSLACPIVAGIAALLRSYFPRLNAKEIVAIIKTSGSFIDVKINMPAAESKLISLSELCNTGRIVNAANAIKMALKYDKRDHRKSSGNLN